MLRQIVYMIASSLSFALMGVFVRSAGETHVVWKVFARNFVVLVLILASMPLSSWPKLLGHRENRWKLVVRGLAGTLGIAGYFMGLEFLPLANASILNRLNPFFVSILGVFILRQKLTPVQIISLVLAFAGAVLVVEPGGDFPPIPTFAALASALFAALAYVMIRLIGSSEDPRTVMAYFAALSLLSSIPVILVLHATIAVQDLLSLAAIGVCAGLGQWLLTMAYRDGHAGTIAAFGYSNVVFAAILGWALYGERGSWFFFIGAGLILESLILLYSNQRRTEATAQK